MDLKKSYNNLIYQILAHAGLIVLAKDVEGETGYLKKLDITVERNSFGRQVDSFEAELDIKGIVKTLKVYLLEHLISLMLKRA